MFHRSSTSRALAVLVTAIALLLSGCGLLPASTASSDSTTPAATSGDPSETATEEGAPPAVPTAVILDASGSMLAEDAPGQRFEAARDAVHDLIDAIPDGQETSLLTYGTETGNTAAEAAAGCQDVSTLIEAGPIDKAAFGSAVDGVSPSGYTPIALALQTAAEQLPETGPRAIVLLSDGIDACADEGEKLDPCAVAGSLAGDGGLAVHTVGFRVDGQTSQQLSCLSEATGGTSWDAINDSQLSTRLAMTLNPELAESLLAPGSYRGLVPGMTADEAKSAGGFSNDIAATGRVEIVYIDCTLVFEDGILTEIVSDSLATLDQIAPGDDVSDAEAVYADADLPTSITDDGAALYTADPIAGTGYKIYFEGATSLEKGAAPSGTITKIVLCACTTTDSYTVAAPPVGIFPECMTQEYCEVIDSVQVQHPVQGALTLVMLNRDNGYDEAWGSVYVVDAQGRVTDTEGNLAGSGNDTAGGYLTTGYPNLSEAFQFRRPTTDRSGMVFYQSPGADGVLSEYLSIDETGYFTQGDVTIDYTGVPDTDEYYTSTWAGIDENGYYILRLGEHYADPVDLYREGDTYVVR